MILKAAVMSSAFCLPYVPIEPYLSWEEGEVFLRSPSLFHLEMGEGKFCSDLQIILFSVLNSWKFLLVFFIIIIFCIGL